MTTFYEFIKNDSIRRRYKTPVTFPSIRSQHRYFEYRFKDSLLFFQVGCYFEIYRRMTEEQRRALGLREVKRPSIRGFIYGFPVSHEEKYLKRAGQAGLSVAVIKETGRIMGKVKERRVERRVLPRNVWLESIKWQEGSVEGMVS